MSTRSILKISSLLAGIAWAVYLAIQWNDYSIAMSALEGNAFGKLALAIGKDTIEAVKNRLIIHSLGAGSLILLGIFIKGDESPTAAQDSKEDKHQAPPSQAAHSSKTEHMSFMGERAISNDKYKLFLIEKYQIQKNEVLNKFLCHETLFDTVEEALTHAALSEETHLKEITEREVLRVKIEQQRNSEAAENLRLQKMKFEEEALQKQIAWQAGAPKRKRAILLASLLFIGIALAFAFNKEIKEALNPVKSYKEYRKTVMKEGWTPYIRTNKFKDWKPPYPEVEFCYEDVCSASFIHSNGKDVRSISFGICSKDRYVQCPGKEDGFEMIEKDAVISKSESDKDFLQTIRQFGSNQSTNQSTDNAGDRITGASAQSATALARLDGRWYSDEWKYGYALLGGEGTATISNSPNFMPGDKIIFLKSLGDTRFAGEQVYKDGKFYRITANLMPDGRLAFQGERGVNWIMRRDD